MTGKSWETEEGRGEKRYSESASNVSRFHQSQGLTGDKRRKLQNTVKNTSLAERTM